MNRPRLCSEFSDLTQAPYSSAVIMKTKNMILYALSNLGDMLLSHASSQSTSALADVHKRIAGGGAGYMEARH